jgi:hypothetical protein
MTGKKRTIGLGNAIETNIIGERKEVERERERDVYACDNQNNNRKRKKTTRDILR